MKRLLPLLSGFILYTWWSWGLTAPNLVLTSWQPYWTYQNWMWNLIFNSPAWRMWPFLLVLILLLGGYTALIKWGFPQANRWKLWLLVILILGASFHALSLDVFNYIFNAKMVSIYQVNPHQHVALEFATDPWTRFMHNTHTPAPYGYGWTVLSLLPFSVGLGRFLLTWLGFKFFSVLSLLGLAWVYQRYQPNKNTARWQWIVLFNPLLLIEVTSNAHNDLWMAVPALWALVILFTSKRRPWYLIALSGVALLLSASIKVATIVLLPLWIAGMMRWLKTTLHTNSLPLIAWLHDQVGQHWALLASVALFLPLLTPRAKFFLPWYLIWSLVWLPYIETSHQTWLSRFAHGWRWFIVSMSGVALLRYVPWLWTGGYTPESLAQQHLIIGVGLILSLILAITVTYTKKPPR